VLKKVFKIIVGIVLVIVLSYFAYNTYLCLLINKALNPTPISKEKIVLEFHQNKEKFLNVAQYLNSLSGDVTIDAEQDNKYSVKTVKDGKLNYITVDDKRIDADIKYILFKLRYRNIISSERDIDYIKQSSRNWSRGVVYSKDGSKPYRSKNSTLEEIDEGWYFLIDNAK